MFLPIFGQTFVQFNIMFPLHRYFIVRVNGFYRAFGYAGITVDAFQRING
jgi:hypothetical protein